MRFGVIGDVHGCAEEFEALLQQLKQERLDYIIQIGDLIHKGPFSKEAVSLSQHFVDIQIAGNHEYKHLRWLKHQRAGTAHQMRNVDNYEAVQLTDNQEEYLYNSLCAFSVAGCTFVHGGLRSNESTEHFATINSLALKNLNNKKDSSFLFRRFEDENNNVVHLDHENDSSRYWASKYEGQCGYVFFGHQVFPTPALFPYAMGIDTGCVYGGQLTAVIFDEQSGTFTPIQINAKQTYYKKETFNAN